MRASKVKAIRRAMRADVEQGTAQRWIAHPLVYTNVNNDQMVKFRFQYVNEGGKHLVALGKTIYRLSGVLPRSPNASSIEDSRQH